MSARGDRGRRKRRRVVETEIRWALMLYKILEGGSFGLTTKKRAHLEHLSDMEGEELVEQKDGAWFVTAVAEAWLQDLERGWTSVRG